jgi:hypothetical protein
LLDFRKIIDILSISKVISTAPRRWQRGACRVHQLTIRPHNNGFTQSKRTPAPVSLLAFSAIERRIYRHVAIDDRAPCFCRWRFWQQQFVYEKEQKEAKAWWIQ